MHGAFVRFSFIETHDKNEGNKLLQIIPNMISLNDAINKYSTKYFLIDVEVKFPDYNCKLAKPIWKQHKWLLKSKIEAIFNAFVNNFFFIVIL